MRLADRYRQLRRVGEGGGGGVWLVEDRLADNAVMVLKRLNAQAQASLAQWLVNEFQVLAQLDLPTIAPVHDFGLSQADAEDPGGAFFTRAFVDGRPLDEALASPGSAPDADRVRALVANTAATLRELHRLGVVHGDLKPANLIVPLAGDRVVLIDFGLAHGALGAAARVRGGTLGFMPPERQAMLFAGEALPPDPRADVYALGASLRCVLAGSSLPSPSDAPPPPLVEHDPALRTLWDLSSRAVAEDPARRIATMDDLLAALGISPEDAQMHGAQGRVVLRPEGREAELGTLLDAVARRLVLREAGIPVVLLVGEQGSGRSTLLRELAWRAQMRGVQTLSLPCEPGDGPMRRLREGAAILGGTPLDPAEPDALANALRRASGNNPVLVLADDLDRADPGVAAQLRSIAYGCEAGDALLVVATAADATAVAALDPALRVDLPALDETAVASLCAQILGAVEPAVVTAVHRRTGGLPLAVTEMLVALARDAAVSPADVERVELPARAKDLAKRRVYSLSEPARAAAAAIAALGGEGTPEVVRAVVPAPEALEVARAAGIVTVRPDGRMALAAATFEEPLLEALSPSVRGDVLLRVAVALDVARASSAVRASAWLRAGDYERAAAVSSEAVASLRCEGLPLAAARLLEALRTARPDRVTAAERYEEAELLHEAGMMEAASAMAESVATAEGVPGWRARLLRGKILRGEGDGEGAEKVLSEVASDARAEPDLAAEAMVEGARAAMLRGDFAVVRARCVEAAGVGVSPAVRASAKALGGVAAVYSGETAEGMRLLEDARQEFATLSLPREEAALLVYLAVGKERSGDLEGARALHDLSLERARAAGDLRAMVTARINLGHIAQRTGDLAAVIEHNQAAQRLAQRAGLRPAVLHAKMNTASQLIRVGSMERARAELESALSLARETGYREMEAMATLMLGVVQCRGGDVDGGLARIDEAESRFRTLGLGEDTADALLDAAEVLLDRGASGDGERAAEKLSQARTVEGERGSRDARAQMLEGRVALCRGDARGALRTLGEAATLAEAQRDWEVHAQSLAARAQAHNATGADLHGRRDRERAVEVLEEKAAMLPPDLRSAFWSVPRRAALRAEAVVSTPGSALLGTNPDTSFGAPERTQRRSLLAGVTALGLRGAVNAPTLIATDERLLLLIELTRRLGEELSFDRVLDQAVRSAVELTGAERGAVLLATDAGVLEVRVRTGPSRGDGPDDQFSRSISETVWIDGEPVVTLDARGDRRFADFRSVHDLGVCAVAAVPIRFRGRTLGVLYVESRRRRVAWATSDVALMLAFAEQAAIAVEHCRLVEELETRTRELEAAKREIEALLETRTHELEATRSSLVRAQEALGKRFTVAGMIGHTEAMKRVCALIERLRDSEIPVVIEGESGTGKEMVARALHFSGARAKGPFVVVHCGAIPETLLESELFGHVRGAFTGADRDRKGLIASAHGGTLLLDEVSEMSPRMQVELLRVIQDRAVRPVGADRDEPVEVRLVAATNRPLKDLVSEGRFREDLYYRLAVVTLRVPSLRDRLEDIPSLATHFLAGFAEEQGGSRKRLSREALQRLLRAAWPGNVRQLRHALESAAVLCEDEVIDAEELSLGDDRPSLVPPPPGVTAGPTVSAVRKASERQRIVDALEQVNWNKVRAAQALKMPRRTLYRRLKEYGLLD